MLVRLTTAWPEAALPQLAQRSPVEIRTDRHGEENLAGDSDRKQLWIKSCFYNACCYLPLLKSTFIKIKINLSLAEKREAEKQNETSNMRAWNGCVMMKCTWKGLRRFPPLQINGKVKITASGAAKLDNCRKSYSEWIWKCEEPAGGQQQDRIGLFVSVRGVFIEQV